MYKFIIGLILGLLLTSAYAGNGEYIQHPWATGVSCGANTVVLTTFTVVSGIVTHC